jgi:hypothetical protein
LATSHPSPRINSVLFAAGLRETVNVFVFVYRLPIFSQFFGLDNLPFPCQNTESEHRLPFTVYRLPFRAILFAVFSFGHLSGLLLWLKSFSPDGKQLAGLPFIPMESKWYVSPKMTAWRKCPPFNRERKGKSIEKYAEGFAKKGFAKKGSEEEKSETLCRRAKVTAALAAKGSQLL